VLNILIDKELCAWTDLHLLREEYAQTFTTCLHKHVARKFFNPLSLGFAHVDGIAQHQVLISVRYRDLVMLRTRLCLLKLAAACIHTLCDTPSISVCTKPMSDCE